MNLKSLFISLSFALKPDYFLIPIKNRRFMHTISTKCSMCICILTLLIC